MAIALRASVASCVRPVPCARPSGARATPLQSAIATETAGFSAVIGLCGTSATASRGCVGPRAPAMSAGSCRRSEPRPSTLPPRHGSRPSSAIASVVLPAPLAPTMPSASPARRSNCTLLKHAPLSVFGPQANLHQRRAHRAPPGRLTQAMFQTGPGESIEGCTPRNCGDTA